MSYHRQMKPARHLSMKKKPKQVPAVDPRFDGQRRPIDRPVRTSRSIPVVDLPSNGPPVPNLINLPDRVTPAGSPPGAFRVRHASRELQPGELSPGTSRARHVSQKPKP